MKSAIAPGCCSPGTSVSSRRWSPTMPTKFFPLFPFCGVYWYKIFCNAFIYLKKDDVNNNKSGEKFAIMEKKTIMKRYPLSSLVTCTDDVPKSYRLFCFSSLNTEYALEICLNNSLFVVDLEFVKSG